MGWTVTFEARGEKRASLDDALEELFDLLVDRGGVVSSSTNGDRYGAAFEIDEPVENVASAVSLGHVIFTTLAKKSGLPVWPVVCAEVLTFEERDRELASQAS